MGLKLHFNLMQLLNSSGLSSEKKKALTPFIKRDGIKREFGRRMIDKIRERTQSGKDKNNRSFSPNVYSKMYRKSLEFRVYGKTSRPVTLQLSGEMQANINVLKTDRTGVTIGFVSEGQSEKAKGHINGSGFLPVRDFWGCPVADQQKILKSVIKDFNAENASEALESALSAVGDLALETIVENADDFAAGSVAINISQLDPDGDF